MPCFLVRRFEVLEDLGLAIPGPLVQGTSEGDWRSRGPRIQSDFATIRLDGF